MQASAPLWGPHCYRPPHHMRWQDRLHHPLSPPSPAGRRIASTVSSVILLRGVLQALGGMAASLQGAACPLMQVQGGCLPSCSGYGLLVYR